MFKITLEKFNIETQLTNKVSVVLRPQNHGNKRTDHTRGTESLFATGNQVGLHG